MNGHSNETEFEKILNDDEENKKWLADTLSELGWSTEYILQQIDDEVNLVQCTYNRNHWIKPSSQENHEKYCKYQSLGYTKEEIVKEEERCIASGSQTVHIDDNTFQTIMASIPQSITGVSLPRMSMPLTVERESAVLTDVHKMAVYDYCAKHFKELRANQNKLKAFTDDDLALLPEKEEKKELSHWEQKARERDMKRRKQSYKGKTQGITTAKKTHLEVIRELIVKQTDLLAELWQTDGKETGGNPKHSMTSYDKSSHDRHTSYRSRSNTPKRSRYRSQSRDRDKESGSKDIKKHHHRDRSRSRERSKRRRRSRSKEITRRHRYRSRSKDRKTQHQSRSSVTDNQPSSQESQKISSIEEGSPRSVDYTPNANYYSSSNDENTDIKRKKQKKHKHKHKKKHSK